MYARGLVANDNYGEDDIKRIMMIQWLCYDNGTMFH
jgi:hypothetical protein